MDSIVDSVKKTIGITVEDESFDVDLIVHINSIFMVLNQLGIGPREGFAITNKDQKWSDYLADSPNVKAVESYMILRVKALFDPASTSYTQQAFEKICLEMEWRLVYQQEHPYIAPTPP